jgi:ABC-type nitrate/sulfonate/bicarbonate transport system substrate-binding protein
MRNTIRTIIVVSLSVLIASGLGCKRGTEDGAEEIVEIDFLLDWKAGPEYLGYIVAVDKGYYADVGLDVTLIEGTGAPDAIKVVAAGKYKLGVSSAAATVTGKSEGMPVISLAAIFQRSPVVIYALTSSGISEPSDLVGKKLGCLYGSSSYNEYKGMMGAQGIPLEDVIEVGASWDVQPLVTGEVDALMGYTQNQPNLVRKTGHEVNEIFVDDWGVNIYGSVVVANTEWLEGNEEVTRKFVEASIKGWEFCRENPEEAVEICLEKYPGLERDFVTASNRDTLPLLESDDTVKYGLGYQTEERWLNTQSILKDQGLIEKEVEPDGLFTNAFLPE